MHASGEPVTTIAGTLGVSRATVYGYSLSKPMIRGRRSRKPFGPEADCLRFDSKLHASPTEDSQGALPPHGWIDKEPYNWPGTRAVGVPTEQ